MKSRDTPDLNREKIERLRKTESTVSDVGDIPASREPAELPTATTIKYLRRFVVRKYGVFAAEVDDVIGDAQVSYLRAQSNGQPVDSGLFFVIACRKACDDLRRRLRRPLALQGGPDTTSPDVDRLEITWLARFAHRSFAGRNVLERGRLEALVRRMAGGAAWSEACTQVGVPRGSQSRYRKTLQACFAASRSRVRSHPS